MTEPLSDVQIKSAVRWAIAIRIAALISICLWFVWWGLAPRPKLVGTSATLFLVFAGSLVIVFAASLYWTVRHYKFDNSRLPKTEMVLTSMASLFAFGISGIFVFLAILVSGLLGMI